MSKRWQHLILKTITGIMAWQGVPASADEIVVAVASNFSPVAQQLAQGFESQSTHRVTLVTGSTGSLYAQIINGAPFDAFLAADAERPRLLEQQNLTVPGSRFTYATGRLVLWSRDPELFESGAAPDFSQLGTNRLAIANPRLAPYGVAARETLERLMILPRFEKTLVLGENIGQTYAMIHTGNVKAGFIALSQLTSPATLPLPGSHWVVDPHLYSPIVQQAVILARTTSPDTTREFTSFLQSREATELIRLSGYFTDH